MISWEDLRYLRVIAGKGSLVQAAKQLGVDHSTVSRRLSALESALGVKLFTRGAEGLVPSRALGELVPFVEEMQRQVEGIERSISGHDQRLAGKVRITTSEAISGYFVQLLSELRARYPEISVEVLSGNQAYDLLRGEADIAVRARALTEPELIARRLTTAVWALYATPDYIARRGRLTAPEALAGHDIVGYDAKMAGTPGGLWFDAHGARASTALRCNSIGSALNGALVGMGIAALPCFLADGEATLRRIADASIGERDVWLVVHPDLPRIARVRVVMDFMIEHFERDGPRWRGERPIAG
ncbi:MAG TPA: LysR family transcriptional regulator [Polyangiales bacterium]